MDRFEELLKELEKIYNVSLHPDKNRACLLNVNNVLHVQIEIDSSKDRVLVAVFICDVPPGKFRELCLKEALKTNDYFPRIGTLGFSERNNKLTLHDFLPLATLHGQQLGEYLNDFIAKADLWRTSVERGTLPEGTAKAESGKTFPFGLKP